MITVKWDIESLKEFLEGRMAELHIPGLAIGFIKDGETLFCDGLGFADVERQTKVTCETVFRMGSISKTFTTLGLFQQWEKGKFQLEDPINEYLPYGSIRPKNPKAPPITFQHLLTHTSGIGELLKLSDLLRFRRFVNEDPSKLYSLRQIFEREIHLKLEPETKWAYANFGYYLLGYLLEEISEIEFSRYMIKNLFNPLEMDHSDFVWSARVKPHQAKGYKYTKGEYVEFGTAMQTLMPAGSLYASIGDMTRYMRCLLNGGSYKGTQLLKKETLDLLTSPHYQLDPRLKAMGYCFWIYDLEGYKIYGHGGSINGYLAEMYLLPEERAGLIVALNQNSIRDMGAMRIAHEILHKILDLPDPKARLKPIPYTLDVSTKDSIQGRYGPEKGVLTNTRFYMAGGEIRIRWKKERLVYKTLWGNKKHGVKLWPASPDDPLYYNLVDKLDYGTVEPYETVIFRKNEAGEITLLLKGFHAFRKKRWFESFIFKFYSRLLFFITGIIALIQLLNYL